MWKVWKGRVAQFFAKPQIHRIPRGISEEQLLLRTSRGWYIGTRRLSNEEVAALKADAQQFANSHLWRVMRNDIHYLAYLQATANRRTDEDALYAGAMYRNLEILEQFIANCKTL